MLSVAQTGLVRSLVRGVVRYELVYFMVLSELVCGLVYFVCCAMYVCGVVYGESWCGMSDCVWIVGLSCTMRCKLKINKNSLKLTLKFVK